MLVNYEEVLITCNLDGIVGKTSLADVWLDLLRITYLLPSDELTFCSNIRHNILLFYFLKLRTVFPRERPLATLSNALFTSSNG